MGFLPEALAFYIVLLISLVVHEASHATVALLGGDKTAYHGGQVTLNPIPHMQREPFGTILLPWAMLLMSKGTMCFGYAHAPVDAIWAHKNPRKAALMAAAGPCSNFLLALLAALLLKVLVMNGLVSVRGYQFPFSPADGSDEGLVFAICKIATLFMFLNVILGVLNLIPFPPLDGASVVGGLFPRSAGRFFDGIREVPMLMIGVFVLIFFAMSPGGPLFTAFGVVYRFLVDIVRG